MVQHMQQADHYNICNDGDFDLCTTCYKKEGHIHPTEQLWRSPSVTSRSLTSLDVATMDLTLEDSVLPIQAKKAVKVLANIIENTAVTRQYVTVKRKRKNLADPNSCKTT